MLFGLKHKRQFVVSHRLWHRLAAKAINNAGLGRTQCMGRIHYMAKQWLACQFVQHLGQLGAHPRALARRENQDFKHGMHLYRLGV